MFRRDAVISRDSAEPVEKPGGLTRAVRRQIGPGALTPASGSSGAGAPIDRDSIVDSGGSRGFAVFFSTRGIRFTHWCSFRSVLCGIASNSVDENEQGSRQR